MKSMCRLIGTNQQQYFAHGIHLAVTGVLYGNKSSPAEEVDGEFFIETEYGETNIIINDLELTPLIFAPCF